MSLSFLSKYQELKKTFAFNHHLTSKNSEKWCKKEEFVHQGFKNLRNVHWKAWKTSSYSITSWKNIRSRYIRLQKSEYFPSYFWMFLTDSECLKVIKVLFCCSFVLVHTFKAQERKFKYRMRTRFFISSRERLRDLHKWRW